MMLSYSYYIHKTQEFYDFNGIYIYTDKDRKREGDVRKSTHLHTYKIHETEKMYCLHKTEVN